jgi:hypothetical protein
METPSAESAAVMILVQLSLKALDYVIHLAETCIEQGSTSVLGALAAAADQDYRSAFVIFRAGGTAKQELADIGDEVGIDGPLGLVDPGDMH